MHKIKLLSLIFSLVLVSGCAVKKTENEEQKIVATSVATLEILDKLNIDGVVGRPDTQNYQIPKRYENAKGLGSPMQPDMETLKSLSPTIVLSPNSLEGELKSQYDAIGVSSYFVDLKSVDGMYKSIQDLGKMFHREKEAEALYKEYETFKQNLKVDRHGKKPPKVLILMGLPGSYVVATESSYVGSLVKLAGAKNVYGDGDGKDFLNVNTEDMLKKNPDIILRTSHAMPDQVMEMFQEEFENNDIWKHFDAVKEDKVYDLDNQYFGMSATFRYKEALEALNPVLYDN